jgi:CBS domain-containing protein
MMLCSEVMKKNVECLRQSDTVQAAARRMRDKNIGFMPICDDANRVIGTITDRDLTLRVLADAKAANTTVKDVMTSDVVTCQPNDELKRALEIMGRRQKSRILCTDKDGHAIGVISLSDVIARTDGPAALQTMRQVTSREARA